MIRLKRGDLEGAALEVYVPARRGARHYADSFSHGLFLAKKLRHYGEQFAHDLAGDLAALLPEGVTMIASPPPGRVSQARGWYFARELCLAVAQEASAASGKRIQIARPLRWLDEGREAAKHTMTQAGQGRKLGRVVAECVEDLRGMRVAVVDDLFCTGISAALSAEALEKAGAQIIGVYCLAAVERTESRPPFERARIANKRRQRAARQPTERERR